MSLSPLDESGRPVDWWFMYKVPRLAATADTGAAKGFEYAYFDSNAQVITRSPYTLDSDNGALFHTLDALFSNPSANTGWILYNDETPAGQESPTLGHTKGVIGFDVGSNTAFWLLHSWPKFPTPDDTAQPSPMFGQTFLCIALDLDAARQLATQMHGFQEPQVYSPRIPTSLAVDDPLRLLTMGIGGNDPPGSNTLDLTSRGAKAFKVIAKDRNWDEDFWNDLVVDVIDASIDVDTWIRGKNVIPPDTDPSHQYTVADIKYITLEEVGLPWAWPETKDHAKWAISDANQGNWVCVGDINRMISQRRRGGCTIAFQEATLWGVLSRTDRFVIPPGSGLSQEEARAKVLAASRMALATAQAERAAAHAARAAYVAQAAQAVQADE
jgi:deoxyribonuclease-2